MIQSEKDYVKDLGVIVEVGLTLLDRVRRFMKLIYCLLLRASCPGWKSEEFQKT